MREMIAARRMSEAKEDRCDLFSSLLDATDEDENVLSEDDLMGIFQVIPNLGASFNVVTGNIFIFMLAGHEVRVSSKVFQNLSLKLSHSTDNRAHIVFRTRSFSIIQRRAREALSTHQKCLPE